MVGLPATVGRLTATPDHDIGVAHGGPTLGAAGVLVIDGRVAHRVELTVAELPGS
jgi:hypothetical protein